MIPFLRKCYGLDCLNNSPAIKISVINRVGQISRPIPALLTSVMLAMRQDWYHRKETRSACL